MHSPYPLSLAATPLTPEVRGMPWLADAEFTSLREAARRISEGQHEVARAVLDRLPRDADSSDGPERRLLAVFTRALGEACSSAGASALGNLYMDEVDAGSMIRAYQVMVAHTPFIRFAYAAANHTLLAHGQRLEAMRVIDIGMGAGSQWLDFFARATALPAQFQLTGIDVPDDSARGDEALQAAGARVCGAARARQREIGFTAIPARIESLAVDRLRSDEAPLFLNALLALHHTPSGDAVDAPLHGRKALLRRLRSLQPAGMVIVEPDAEHDSLAFVPRVDEALRHYATVFAALDALLPRDLAERRTIETRFFGREVLNIVAGEGAARVERHQRREGWARSLHAAGFVAQPLPVTAQALADELALPAAFSITDDAGMRVLRFAGSPLLAASAWGCAPMEAAHVG